MPKEMNSTSARQGSKGRPILIVLVAALALVIIGYLLTGWIGGATEPGDTVKQSQTVPNGTSDTSATGTNTGEVTPSTPAPAETGTKVNPAQ
ncbi:hypothetical protein [Jiella sp. M17.18]|uniref:hypothetical protein n=1 Tax=Jiella sp. M17.18 TaxID=3234247 RepID=UPI0034DF52B2